MKTVSRWVVVLLAGAVICGGCARLNRSKASTRNADQGKVTQTKAAEGKSCDSKSSPSKAELKAAAAAAALGDVEVFSQQDECMIRNKNAKWTVLAKVHVMPATTNVPAASDSTMEVLVPAGYTMRVGVLKDPATGNEWAYEALSASYEPGRGE